MQELIDSLSLEEKIGQRFIFGTNSENIEIIEKLIKQCHIGGVILYKKNYKTYTDMLEVIKRLKEANKNNKIPLFIAIDQEGGIVNRMPNEVKNLTNIYDLSKKNELLVNDYAKIISKMLKETGINMNLGPVLDIYNNSEALSLYKRCFYGNSDKIIKLGKEYLKEMNKNGVISVIKHFPGHGLTKIDSHHLTPYVWNYKKMDKHIKPFNELMDKADSIMLGHITIRKKTNNLPCSISNKFIDKYLGDFKGIIMTDEINMLKRHPIYRFVYLKKALKSYNDILLIKIKTLKEGYKFINKYKKLYNIDKLNKSTLKILTIKNRYKINDSTENLGMIPEEINKEIEKINNNID